MSLLKRHLGLSLASILRVFPLPLLTGEVCLPVHAYDRSAIDQSADSFS